MSWQALKIASSLLMIFLAEDFVELFWISLCRFLSLPPPMLTFGIILKFCFIFLKEKVDFLPVPLFCMLPGKLIKLLFFWFCAKSWIGSKASCTFWPPESVVNEADLWGVMVVGAELSPPSYENLPSSDTVSLNSSTFYYWIPGYKELFAKLFYSLEVERFYTIRLSSVF